MNNHVFPIDTVLTILCEYAINEHQNEEIQADPTWPVLLFVNNLGVAHAIVTRVLERILDAQEAPFTGRRRKAVVRWILMACELWVREVERRGLDGQQGGGNIGRWTVQLLSRAVEAMREIAATERAANRPEHELEAQGLMAAAMELAAKINQVLGLEEARPGRGGW
jgi:nuclear pore complex protein Nup155